MARRSAVRAWLRATLAGSVVAAALLTVGVRQVLARADQAVDAWGEQLVGSLPGFVDQPETLLVNGEALRVSSVTGERTVKQVLDAFEAECLQGRAAAGTRVSTAHDSTEGLTELRQLLVHRKETSGAGRLVCLSLPAEIQGWSSLNSAFQQWSETGNLESIASFRVVRVRQVGKPSEGRTQALAVWSEGPFHPLRALNAEGGVDGHHNSTALPTPAGARHDFDFAVPGRAYGVHAYRLSAPRDAALEYYERELPSRGWRLFDPEEWALDFDRPDKGARVFVRGTAVAYVAALPDESAGGTRVVLLHSGAAAAQRGGS